MLDTEFDINYGDIFEDLRAGRITTIIHAMNRRGRFNTGFSRQLADEFPEAVAADAQDYADKGKHDKGGVSLAVVGGTVERPLFVVNMYCIRDKRKNGSLLSMKQLGRALDAVNAITENGEADHVVGFPKIGAGIAGGDWGEVFQQIEARVKAPGVLYLPTF